MSANVFISNRTRDRFLQLVRDAKPDVVVVLEADYSWVDELESLADLYPHRHHEPAASAFSIALLSRLPISDVEVRDFGPPGIPSITAWLEDDAGNEFQLIGTHPLPPLDANRSAIRNEQLAAMAEYAVKLSGPVVVLGDLNSTSWSPYFRDFIRRTGMRDSRNGFGNQPTHPTYSYWLGIAIDHVLVSPEIAVRNRWVGPDIGSDHRPVIVDLVIPASATR